MKMTQFLISTPFPWVSGETVTSKVKLAIIEFEESMKREKNIKFVFIGVVFPVEIDILLTL